MIRSAKVSPLICRIVLSSFAIAFLACQTTQRTTEELKREAQLVESGTVIPPTFSRGIGYFDGRLRVPSEMLAENVVARRVAELRSGPGVDFQLTDHILSQGTRVLVFNQVGVWRKVFVPKYKKSGWVHKRTLRPLSGQSSDPHTIAESDLPTVITWRPVAQVKSYPDKMSLKTRIPKGAIFRKLKSQGKDTLVWLATTNSVMWLKNKDIR